MNNITGQVTQNTHGWYGSVELVGPKRMGSVVRAHRYITPTGWKKTAHYYTTEELVKSDINKFSSAVGSLSLDIEDYDTHDDYHTMMRMDMEYEQNQIGEDCY
jgi:hypothetical protein